MRSNSKIRQVIIDELIKRQFGKRISDLLRREMVLGNICYNSVVHRGWAQLMETLPDDCFRRSGCITMHTGSRRIVLLMSDRRPFPFKYDTKVTGNIRKRVICWYKSDKKLTREKRERTKILMAILKKYSTIDKLLIVYPEWKKPVEAALNIKY